MSLCCLRKNIAHSCITVLNTEKTFAKNPRGSLIFCLDSNVGTSITMVNKRGTITSIDFEV
jgi:hypothetical protein